MPEKIIKTLILPSGRKATAFETEADTLALEVGSGIIFLKDEDLYSFIRLLKAADKFFLTKCDDGEKAPINEQLNL